jgi:hypothetical protein
MSNRQKVFKILDDLPEGNYFGRDITELVYQITIKRPYDSTILTYCREYADISGSDFYCIDKQKSRYYYKPNCKISGAYQ